MNRIMPYWWVGCTKNRIIINSKSFMTIRHLKGRTRDFLLHLPVHLDWRVTDWLRGWLRIVLPSLLWWWWWWVKSAIIIMSLLRVESEKDSILAHSFVSSWWLMAQLWTSFFSCGWWCVFLAATSHELVDDNWCQAQNEFADVCLLVVYPDWNTLSISQLWTEEKMTVIMCYME